MTGTLKFFYSCLASSMLLLCVISTSQAALLAYEPFDYPLGEQLDGKNSGLGFTNAWNGQTNATGATIQAGLSHAGVPTSGNSVLLSGDPSTQNIFRSFPNIAGADGTSTYISFIAQRLGDPMGTGANTYLRGTNVGFFNTEHATRAERATIGNSSNASANTWAFIPTGSGGSIVPTTNPAVTFGGGPQVWAVLRIDHVGPAGDDTAKDSAYLFINPDPTTEPAVSSANAKLLAGDTGAFDYSGLDYVRPFIGNANSTASFGVLSVDELRIGTTYADMTRVPEPSTLILLSLCGLASCFRRLRR